MLKKLKYLEIPDDHFLISLDVSSLYTNIPYILVENSLGRRHHIINNKSLISYDRILEITQFLFKNVFFTFNNKFYRQKNGVAMGDPVSPFLQILLWRT